MQACVERKGPEAKAGEVEKRFQPTGEGRGHYTISYPSKTIWGFSYSARMKSRSSRSWELADVCLERRVNFCVFLLKPVHSGRGPSNADMLETACFSEFPSINSTVWYFI